MCPPFDDLILQWRGSADSSGEPRRQRAKHGSESEQATKQTDLSPVFANKNGNNRTSKQPGWDGECTLFPSTWHVHHTHKRARERTHKSSRRAHAITMHGERPPGARTAWQQTGREVKRRSESAAAPLGSEARRPSLCRRGRKATRSAAPARVRERLVRRAAATGRCLLKKRGREGEGRRRAKGGGYTRQTTGKEREREHVTLFARDLAESPLLCCCFSATWRRD